MAGGGVGHIPVGGGKGDGIGEGDTLDLAGSIFSSPKAQPPPYYIIVVVVCVNGSAAVSPSYWSIKAAPTERVVKMWSESSPFVRFIAWFKSWKNSGLLVKAGMRSCRAFPKAPTYCQCPGMAGVGGETVPALPFTHLRPKYFWIPSFCSLGGFGLIKFKFPI